MQAGQSCRLNLCRSIFFNTTSRTRPFRRSLNCESEIRFYFVFTMFGQTIEVPVLHVFHPPASVHSTSVSTVTLQQGSAPFKYLYLILFAQPHLLRPPLRRCSRRRIIFHFGHALVLCGVFAFCPGPFLRR